MLAHTRADFCSGARQQRKASRLNGVIMNRAFSTRDPQQRLSALRSDDEAGRADENQHMDGVWEPVWDVKKGRGRAEESLGVSFPA